jgi:ribosomal protein L40E
MVNLESDVRCRNPRCGTLLPPDAELCDECGSAELEPIAQCEALLSHQLDERTVVFALLGEQETTIGRSGEGSTPMVDLSRFPESGSVHHLHAAVQRQPEGWLLTHRGRNPLLIRRAGETLPVEPGGSAPISSGDLIVVGSVGLRFLAR